MHLREWWIIKGRFLQGKVTEIHLGQVSQKEAVCFAGEVQDGVTGRANVREQFVGASAVCFVESGFEIPIGQRCDTFHWFAPVAYVSTGGVFGFGPPLSQ